MRKGHFLLLVLIIGMFWFSPVREAQAETFYTVQHGDTLSKIARNHGTTVSLLMAINEISNANLIYVGQVIRIPDGNDAPPAPEQPVSPPPAAPPPQTPPDSNAGGTAVTYVVQPGDTLYRIAVSFGVSVADITLANNIQNSSFITVGQVLTIPGGQSAAAPPTQPNPAPPTQPNPAPTSPPPAAPPPAPPPAAGPDLLVNGSFEGGWYHQNGIPELQLPDGWVFGWHEGPTGFGGQAWDVWVRPEVRVLPSRYLPPEEHGLFIFDGDQTVKIFKGSGAISFWLYQDVPLQPGTYRLEIGIFPDLVVDYYNGEKVWPSDPHAGEIRFIVGGGGSGWIAPAYGQKNVIAHTFTIDSPQTVRVGLAVRGKFAFDNNGWFMDDFELVRQ